MPKWCAISWTTVIVTSSTTSSSVSQMSQIGLAVDHDPVRQRAAVVPAALGQRKALVEAEQVRLVGVAVLDQDDDVVQQRHQLAGTSSRASATSSSNRASEREQASPAGRQRAALVVAGRALHADDRALVELARSSARPRRCTTCGRRR